MCLFICRAENDLEAVLTLVVIPEGGSRQCVEVSANFDGFQEPNESLFLVIFRLPNQPAEFEIEETQMIVPLTILDSKKKIP